MIKTIIILLNFAFNCSLVNETCTIVLVQAGMQANQLTSAIDCAGNIINFTESHTGKSFFFPQDSKETCLIFVSIIKKGVSRRYPICENNTYYVCFH